jgi:hypothetical protein
MLDTKKGFHHLLHFPSHAKSAINLVNSDYFLQIQITVHH